MQSPRRFRLRLLAGVVLAATASMAPAALSQQTLTYGYDELGRISTVTYPDGKQIVYRYDTAGNRTQNIVSATTVNRPPVAVDDAKTTTEGTPLTFDPRTNDSDADSNPLAVTYKTNGTFGTVAIGAGGTSMTYTPTDRHATSDTFTYTISDGNNAADTAKVTMTINNAPPTVVTDAISVNRGATTNITFDPRTNDSDPGQDPFTITAKTNGTKGTVTLNAGGTSLTYKPNSPTLYGSDTFTYTVTDDDGASATGTVNATIQLVNTAPVANTDAPYKVAKSIGGMTVVFDPRVNDTDADGDALTITSATNGTYGTVTVTSGIQLTYARTSNYPPLLGTAYDTFTYTISDGFGGTTVGTVNVSILYDNSCNNPQHC